VIQTEVEDMLSEAMLESRIHDGQAVMIVLRDDKITIEPQAEDGEPSTQHEGEPEALGAA